MDKQNVYEWLRLVNCTGCASPRIWEIMRGFDSVSEACAAIESGSAGKMLTERERSAVKNTEPAQTESLISYCESHNIYIMTFDDEMYPDRLRSIYNPPAVLFCRGDLDCLKNDFTLGIVGTRKPSDYSVKVTAALARELCSYGITVVSGFAVGIDVTANLSAVRSGGKTIAVLGCGLDRDYPRENGVYRGEIEANGLFISEYYPLAGGTKTSFPARNRILSGLSLGVIVTEAAEKSGALITANLALSQGRDIFTVSPHDLFDRRYGGNVALIRDGAVCLCGVKDVLYEYYENYGHKIANAGAAYIRADNIDPLADIKPEAENEEDVKQADGFDASVLDGEEASVFAALKKSETALGADELAEMCGMDISDMMTLLTDLEIEGAVISSAGQRYSAN